MMARLVCWFDTFALMFFNLRTVLFEESCIIAVHFGQYAMKSAFVIMAWHGRGKTSSPPAPGPDWACAGRDGRAWLGQPLVPYPGRQLTWSTIPPGIYTPDLDDGDARWAGLIVAMYTRWGTAENNQRLPELLRLLGAPAPLSTPIGG